MTRKIESPETTGVYLCPKCGNREHFTGIDEHGYGGPDECDSDCGDICECETVLRQNFDVDADGEVNYHSFTGGGWGAEIGEYTIVTCRVCSAIVWHSPCSPVLTSK